MVSILRWPSTGLVPPSPVETDTIGHTHIEPMDPLKLPFGNQWIVDFSSPETYKLIDELNNQTVLV